MSTIVSAVYLWIFTFGIVTQQNWLILTALLALVASALIFRKRGTSAILLVSFASTILVLASTKWQIFSDFSLDPLSEIRKLLTRSIIGVNNDASAIVLGLTLGDDSQVSHELQAAMRTTSLTHLMAVSGANCAIVVGASYFLLARFSIRIRVILSITALAAYVLLVGFQPSVLRASTMALAVLIAISIGQKINPLSALALSVIVLLCLNPLLSREYGFALSVLATAGILIATPSLYQKLATKLPKLLAMGIAVSLGAQLFCLPLLLGLQGGLPTYSLLANLLCEPLVAPITILGLVASIFFWCPPISGAMFWLASVVAWPIPKIASLLADLPAATVPWRLDGVGIALTIFLIGLTLHALNSKSANHRNISLALIAVIVASSCGYVFYKVVRTSVWPMPDWQISSCDVGQGDATVIRDGASVAVIDVGRDNKKIDSCLSRLGVSRIDLLVLTHFDADHVNGLSGAIRNRSVGRALVTSFEDDRPGADLSRLQLEAAAIPTSKTESGLHGSLGSITWKVLSPSRTAIEADDSNDGSVTMLFRFPKFQLLTLADIGEKGQMRLASNLGSWYTDRNLPLVMKVSHHGSSDQYSEFIEWLKPKIALISVGANNGYGHPTRRTLGALARAGAVLLRTDLLGSIALKNIDGSFQISDTGSS